MKDLSKTLDEFNLDEEEVVKTKFTKEKFLIDDRKGLIERVDKIFITEDGRQLLREQY